MTERTYTRIRAIKNLLTYADLWFPTRIGIEIVTTCNRHCYYCPSVRASSEATKFVHPDVYAQFCERIAEYNWSGLVSFNGYSEPLLHPDLPMLIQQLLGRFPKCLPAVYTNGDYLTPKLANVLLSAGCWKIVVTRHSPVTPAWDHKIVGILSEHGAHKVEVRTLQMQDLLNIGGHVPVMSLPRRTCRIPSAGIMVWANGDASFCCCDSSKSHIAGNILNQSIYEIWNNPTYKKVRKEVSRGVARLELCKNCLAGKPETADAR